MVTGREDFCNVSIATPTSGKDWCHDCVKAIPWTDEGKVLSSERHGIDTYNLTTG